MITVRQIDRLWSAKAFDRLLDELVAPRPECSDRLRGLLGGLLGSLSGGQLGGPLEGQFGKQLGNQSRDPVGDHRRGSLPAAAMAVIRLDELSQSFAPLYSQLVRMLLAAQRPDGGWGDVLTTALCLRALLCGNGNGQTIERGIAHLAALQKAEGIWPGEPVRRMPIDPFASAYVLFCLGGNEAFRKAVDLGSAIEWFTANAPALDQPTSRLWSHTRGRLPIPRLTQAVKSAAKDPAKNLAKHLTNTASLWRTSTPIRPLRPAITAAI